LWGKNKRKIMYKKNIDLRICVNGRQVREYLHQGMTFIESRDGSNYTIKIKNDNGARVMAVVSVDGLDVISGKPAEKTNKGYIVDGYSTTEIKGYRLSDSTSAEFVFVSKGKSYSAKSEVGDARNSGVIGIRVFEEKPEKMKVVDSPVFPMNKNPWNPTYATWHGTGSFTSVPSGIYGNQSALYSSAIGGQQISDMSSTTRAVVSTSTAKSEFDTIINYDSFDTGTGWGKQQTDKVKKEYFRKGKLVGELVIYYASTEALTDMGIELTQLPKIAESKMPKAFADSEYCQPPKGWDGNK
jgi:hypothetical protein